MSSWGFAPRATRITFTASGTATQLVSGEPVRVWGFVISNNGTSTSTVVTIESGDGSVTYFTHTFANSEAVVSDIKWTADKGIRMTSTGASFADLNAVFFHSNPGS